MSTGLKVVLWILAIIGGLFVVLMVTGFFVGRSMKGDMDEAMRFARNATHQECEDEFAKRVNACDGMKCAITASVFAGVCLQTAKGDIKEYCADVPRTADKSFGAWSGDFCSRHEIADKQKCNLASGAIVGACGSVNKQSR